MFEYPSVVFITSSDQVDFILKQNSRMFTYKLQERSGTIESYVDMTVTSSKLTLNQLSNRFQLSRCSISYHLIELNF